MVKSSLRTRAHVEVCENKRANGKDYQRIFDSSAYGSYLYVRCDVFGNEFCFSDFFSSPEPKAYLFTSQGVLIG